MKKNKEILEQLEGKNEYVQSNIALAFTFDLLQDPNKSEEEKRIILNNLRKSLKNKEIIKQITELELSLLLNSPKVEQDKNYINKLLNFLPDNEKKYFQALLAKQFNNLKKYENLLRESAFEGFIPAVEKYINLLYKKLNKSNIEKIKIEFEKLSKAINSFSLLGDFFSQIGDMQQAKEYYIKGVQNNEKEAYPPLISLYELQLSVEKNHQKKEEINNILTKLLEEFENIPNLSHYQLLQLNWLKGLYLVEHKNKLLEGANFLAIAYQYALDLNLEKEIEQLGKYIYFNIFEKLDIETIYEEELFLKYIEDIINDLIQINPANINLKINFYKKLNNKVGVVASILEIAELHKSIQPLLNYLNTYLLNEIKNIDYKTLKDILVLVNDNILLTKENLLSALEIQEAIIDKTKLEKIITRLNKDISKIDKIILKIAKGKPITKYDKKFLNNISNKKLDYNNLDKELITLSDNIDKQLNKLEKINSTIEIIRKIAKEKTIDSEILFDIFSLVEPNYNNIVDIVNYFSNLIFLYNKKTFFANLAFYNFLKKLFLKGLEGKSKKNANKIFAYLEKNKKIKNNIIIPESILTTLKNTLEYKKLTKDDMEIIYLILGGDLDEETIIISPHIGQISGKTKFGIGENNKVIDLYN